MKRLYLLIAVIVLIVIGLGYWSRQHHKQAVPASAKPTLVSVTAATLKTIPLSVNALGQVVAPQTIMLKTQTDGIVTNIYFKSGQTVTKGQLLLQLDPTTAKAQAAQQYANYNNLKTQFDRYQKLSKLDNDAVSADMLSQKENLMKAAEAQWQAAEKQLDFTQIKAPFDGVVGVPQQIAAQVATAGASLQDPLQLNVGSFLPAGSAIAILSNPQHMYAQYQVAQSYSSQLQVGQPVTIRISALPNHIFKGKVKFISPIVYQSSEAFEVIASIDNPNPLLRSGMNADVNQVLNPNQQILAIPGLSLVPSLTGYSVYMIENSKVKTVPVTIGQRYNQLVAIKSGLKPGDEIITSGALLVHPGMSVQVKS